MVHKAIHKTAPPYLSELFQKTNTVHSHDTRGATYGLFPKHSNLKFGQRSFASYGCKVWNSLSRDVQAIEKQRHFKKSMKQKLLAQSVLKI